MFLPCGNVHGLLVSGDRGSRKLKKRSEIVSQCPVSAMKIKRQILSRCIRWMCRERRCNQKRLILEMCENTTIWPFSIKFILFTLTLLKSVESLAGKRKVEQISAVGSGFVLIIIDDSFQTSYFSTWYRRPGQSLPKIRRTKSLR